MAALVCLVILVPHDAVAGSPDENPRLSLPPSHLDAPFTSPVFATGYYGFGGGFRNQPGDSGYGGSLIFRPGSSVNPFGTLLDWNCSLVVQVDYLMIRSGGSILSGDLILRHYLNDRVGRDPAARLFLGVGTGASGIRLPDPADAANADYWSVLGEVGQEWDVGPGFMFFLKGQYRWMFDAGRTYQTWTAMVGFGAAWPW